MIELMQRLTHQSEWNIVMTFNDNDLAFAFRKYDKYNLLFPNASHKLRDTEHQMDINPIICRPKFNPEFYGDINS